MTFFIHTKRTIWLLSALLWLEFPVASGQYFGQNKLKYERQPATVLETRHFTWYHSLEKNKPLLDKLTKEAEIWHAAHSRVFRDSLIFENPVVLYHDYTAVQENLIRPASDPASPEPIALMFKNRIDIPLSFTYRQTKQTLGRELVHVFQSQALHLADSTDMDYLRKIPLWLMEGMAAYFTQGRIDPHTAMWMRDAVLHDDIPSISALSDYSKYAPHPFGHAFVAFIGAEYGDDAIVPFFLRTALTGVGQACRDVFGKDQNTLSAEWIQAQKKGYAAWLYGKQINFPSKLLLNPKGDPNHHAFTPSVSPDGRYLIYLTDQSGPGLERHLSELSGGKVLRKWLSTAQHTGLVDLHRLESAGTWSPDSRQFAFVDVQQGKNVLVIIDIQKPKRKKVVTVDGLRAFTQPAWSPDGKSILLTGMKRGQTDLYRYHFRSKQLTNLTEDDYSEAHPSWSPDGRFIYFASDEGNPQGEGRSFQLVTMRADGSEKKILNIFPGADNMNPQADQDGNVYFLSDRDGFRQIYRLEANTGNVVQLTHYQTGISGPTSFTPALSICWQCDQPTLIYSLFQKKKYTLHALVTDQTRQVDVDPKDVDFSAAVLAPGTNSRSGTIEKNLPEWWQSLPDSTTRILTERPYSSRMRLEYIGNGNGMGAFVSNAIGANTTWAGGSDLLLSDLLGEHQLYAGIAMNGNWLDAAGVVQYLNRRNRIFWGISAAHIPYRSGTGMDRGPVDIADESGRIQTVWQYDLLVNRVFQDKLNLILQFPFSHTHRLEVGMGYSLLYERRDLISQYYTSSGLLYGEQKWRIPTPGRAHMACQTMAVIGDNTRFGMASPADGWRYRIALEANQGDIRFLSTLLDVRRYIYSKPFTFAFRLIQSNRFGRDSDRLFPLYTADPMLVRGFQTIRPDDFQRLFQLGAEQLSGNRLMAGNLEWRLPFTGIRKLALIPSRFFLTELAVFADAGISWNPGENKQTVPIKTAFLASAGLSLRVRIARAFIAEPYVAFPVINGKFIRGSFGINLIPGW